MFEQAHRPVLRELVPPHPVHNASLPNGNMDVEDGEAEEGELEEGEAAEEPKDVAMPDAHPEGTLRHPQRHSAGH